MYMVCPLTILMKSTKFDKHVCEGFLLILITSLNLHTYIHIHAQRRCYISFTTSCARGLQALFTLTYVCSVVRWFGELVKLARLPTRCR